MAGRGGKKYRCLEEAATASAVAHDDLDGLKDLDAPEALGLGLELGGDVAQVYAEDEEVVVGGDGECGVCAGAVDLPALHVHFISMRLPGSSTS